MENRKILAAIFRAARALAARPGGKKLRGNMGKSQNRGGPENGGVWPALYMAENCWGCPPELEKILRARGEELARRLQARLAR